MEVMDHKMDNQELISALADGHLQGDAVARAVQAASADARGRQAWCSYHVVGEVLRTGRACTGSAPEAFLARLRERLEEEKPLAAPQPAPGAGGRGYFPSPRQRLDLEARRRRGLRRRRRRGRLEHVGRRRPGPAAAAGHGRPKPRPWWWRRAPPP
jgi:hypothetical protein